jgi:uncharacterized protein YjbI with pentapeptide repeats
MGRMEWLKKTFAPSWQIISPPFCALDQWIEKHPNSFLGLVLGPAVLYLAIQAVPSAEWSTSWQAWKDNSQALRDLGLGFAGLAAATVGLYLAIIRTAAARRQSQAANVQADIAEKGHVTERFSKSVEQLGNERMAVRLGAIYALEQVAKDSPAEYHWPIMETLTAFVRQGDPTPVVPDHDAKVEPSQEDEGLGGETASTGNENREGEVNGAPEPKLPPINADISAAVAVMARRNIGNDPDSRFLDFSGANMTGLSLANVEPRNLAKAQFGQANLEGARLRDANMKGANLFETNLKGADLKGAHLEGAGLLEANLEGANLHGAHLEGAGLTGANLEMAALTEANLEGAGLKAANLKGAGLYKANLERVGLHHANLERAWMVEASLERSSLFEANLEGARLVEANLKGTGLREARLVKANLERADLREANLEGADLSGTHLERANLNKANISVEQLVHARNPLSAELDDDVRTELEALLEANGKAAD